MRWREEICMRNEQQRNIAFCKSGGSRTISKPNNFFIVDENDKIIGVISIDELRKSIEGADMVFITAGMGGGTGTGAAPIVAQIAKEIGALTIAIVTKPFMFEGTRRMVTANEGIETLQKEVDKLSLLSTQKEQEYKILQEV